MDQRLDPRLLDILVCPVTKGPLVHDRARGELVSSSARLAYPIRDGIPVMLESEARRLDQDPETTDATDPPDDPAAVGPASPAA